MPLAKQQFQIPGHRIWRKAAVAYYLSGDSLRHFFAPVFEHLKIGVAVRIDEARSDGQTLAIDHARVCRGCEGVKLSDSIAGNQQIAAPRGRTSAINQRAASQ